MAGLAPWIRHCNGRCKRPPWLVVPHKYRLSTTSQLLNDIIWRALGRAKIQATKEPLGLSRTDGKRPDGVTLISWSRGKCATWDVTVPDSFAQSHPPYTSLAACASLLKTAKYINLQTSHIFVPIEIETAGSWNSEGLDFVCDLGRRLEQVTGDPLELT